MNRYPGAEGSPPDRQSARRGSRFRSEGSKQETLDRERKESRAERLRQPLLSVVAAQEIGQRMPGKRQPRSHRVQSLSVVLATTGVLGGTLLLQSRPPFEWLPALILGTVTVSVLLLLNLTSAFALAR